MKPTHQYLNLSPEEYETKCFKQYYRWCENLATKHRANTQCLLANRAMANYYSDQFRELEHNFKKVAQRLDGLVTTDILDENFNLIMVDIFLNYPKPLIEAAKTLKIINNLNQN
jgi:hypothetical protein